LEVLIVHGEADDKESQLGTTCTNHTARAMRSQEPVKCVFEVLVTSAPPALFPSVFDRLMHLALSVREKNATTQRGFSVILSNIIAYLRLKIVTESVTNYQT
jgi:hypothetical protein